MKNMHIRSISLFTVIILTIYIFASIIATPVIIPKAEAASLENEDIYKGIGIAILLYLLSRAGQDDEEEEIEVDIPDDEDDVIDYRQKDVDLLARVIFAEARGEPYEGQIAVGAVVLNRVEDPCFPNTIEGVIYQDGQFTSVDNGQIDLTPGVTAYNAAYDAIDGIDPSNQALYFYNPEKAETLWWLSTREKTAVIGYHVFAK